MKPRISASILTLSAWLLAAGLALADVKGADLAHKSGNYQLAAQLYLDEANAGNAEAQNAVAIMYAAGEGLKQDYAVAMHWFERSANLGHPDAQYNLAICYLDGMGVDKNPVLAAKWFAIAAEQGMADAQTNLGVAYYLGEGVARDLVESFKWFTIALGSGDRTAKSYREKMASEMDAAQIDTAKARAVAWREAYVAMHRPE